MANNVISVTEGSGKNVATETIGTTDYQQIKLVGGEVGSTSVLGVNPDRSLNASIIGTPTFKITGNPSISGSVSVSNLQGASVSGTILVGAIPSIYGNISGSVVGFQGGAWTTSVVGGPITLYAPSTSLVSGVTSVITGTASILCLPAAAGGQRNYVTQILVTNAAASNTFVDVVDNGAVIYSGYAAASGGGFSASFPAPLKQPSTVSALYVATRTQASVIVAMSGFTAT